MPKNAIRARRRGQCNRRVELMTKKNSDPIAPWFRALEDSGEFIGMRFARVPPGASEPEWIFVRHTDYDGVSAVEKMFRERGGTFDSLPQARHPAKPSARSFWQLLKMQIRPKQRLHWKRLKKPGFTGGWKKHPSRTIYITNGGTPDSHGSK